MKFSIGSLLAVTLAAAVTVALYLWITSPPVLRIGMNRSDVIASLKATQATDMVRPDTGGKYYVLVPYQDYQNDDIAKAEYEREKALLYSAQAQQQFWYLASIGRFEVSFKNGKLTSILKWNGADNESLDYLILKH